jgi:hypothetical protein
MPFAPETQAILDRLEQITNTPIEFSPELNSPYLLAQVTMARFGASAHLVRYKPNVPGVNYNLAFQCGFILRLYETPPAERFDFLGFESGRESVLNMMKGPGSIEKTLGITGEKLVGLASQMFDGIMFQLRSMPIGMRIDDWLYRDYPGLHDEQAASIASQQQTNVQALGPSARTIAPPPIYNANVSMSTAYALFADRMYGKNQYAIPFTSAGYAERGQRLLDLFDSLPKDPTSDRQLVRDSQELNCSIGNGVRPYLDEPLVQAR